MFIKKTPFKGRQETQKPLGGAATKTTHLDQLCALNRPIATLQRTKNETFCTAMLFLIDKTWVDTFHRAIALGNIDIAFHDKPCVYWRSPLQAISDKLPGFFGLNP